jgi:hypothetical protein
MTSRMRLMGIGLGVYLLGFGMLAGVMVDRLWYDHRRSEVLERYEQAVRQWRAQLMALERAGEDRP